MLYCERCGVHLSGTMSRCPLCHGGLSGKPEGENPYPSLPAGNRLYWLIVRSALLATVITLVICVAINFSFPRGGWWSAFVAAGLGSTWLVLWMAVRKRSNPMKAIVWQLAVISALVLLWDWRTGFAGWSINFVLPVFVLCMQLAVAATAWAMRLRPADYLLYLLICVAAGLTPLAPLLCGAVWFVYPSVVCVGVSVIVLAALVLFQGRAVRDEMVRRTHL